MTDFLDQLKKFTIHEDEYNQLSNPQKIFLEQFSDIDYFPNSLDKNGKKINKVSSLRKFIKKLNKIIKKKKDEESNEEGLTIDIIIYLLNRMNLQQLRQLNWEKL